MARKPLLPIPIRHRKSQVKIALRQASFAPWVGDGRRLSRMALQADGLSELLACRSNATDEVHTLACLTLLSRFSSTASASDTSTSTSTTTLAVCPSERPSASTIEE